MRGWCARGAWQRWIVYLALIAFALVLPSPFFASFMSPDTDWTTLLFSPIGTYMLLALGLNIVVGYAGLLDLGYVAFFAVGGYTVACLGTKYGWTFWASSRAAASRSRCIAGVILGAPTLRLRGDYLAIVTLGFGEIVRITANNTDELGGPRGITDIPHPPTIGPAASSAARSRKPVLLPGRLPCIVLVIILSRVRLRAQPGGQGMGGDPRGRGRRRAHGRADLQVQAAGRSRSAPCRRPRRRLYASTGDFITPTTSVHPVDPVPGRGGARRHRATSPA